MTINTLPENFPPDQYTAAPSQTIFNVSFPFYEDSDLTVYLTPVGQPANDASDILALNVDYTVSGADEESGGYITLLTPATSGDIITIQRNTAVERTSAYQNGLPIDMGQLNTDFNKIIMMLQDQLSYLMRTVAQYPDSAIIPNASKILPLLGQNQIWKGTSGGGITASTVVENENCSTLRSDLAQNSSAITAGANLVGYYNVITGSTTVQSALDLLNAASGAFTSILDFGGDNTGVGDNTGAFNDALVYFAANPDNSILYFPQGSYLFNSKPNDIDINLTVIGQGKSITQLIRNYSEGTLANGLFTKGATANCQIRISDMLIYAATGTTGGNAISLYSTASFKPLSPEITNVEIDGDGTFQAGLTIDSNANADSINYAIVNNVSVNSAKVTVASFDFNHIQFSDIETITDGIIIVSGTPGKQTKNCNIFNSGGGATFNLDECSVINFYTPQCANVTNTANTSSINFYGNVTTTKQTNWLTSAYIASNDFTNTKVSAISGTVNTGNQVLPNGLIMKWGIVTVTGVLTSAAVTFASSFPNAIATVQITPRIDMPFDSNTTTTNIYYADSPSTSGFTLRWSEGGAGAGTNWSFMWTAWGY